MISRERIAGVDEVGRGPLAGPVVVAATVFGTEQKISHFHDSKSMTEKKREALVEEILTCAQDWALVAIGPRTIDVLNILQATRRAMSLALSHVQTDRALVDGNMRLETSTPFQSIIKGDTLHPEIGAASILAKVWRDRLMKSYDHIFEGYAFKTHKGYPTKVHKEALQKLGPSPIHRYSYRTVAELSRRREQLPLCNEGDELIISRSQEGKFYDLPTPAARTTDSFARVVGGTVR